MKSTHLPLQHLAVARSLLLEPFGLDESRLQNVLAEIFEHRVDHADLYFQFTRSEGWSLEGASSSRVASRSIVAWAFAR